MIVVNFSTRAYSKGQDRLRDSLRGHRSLMIHEYKRGWRTHQDSPYEFKINAIEEGFKKDDIVLWADSSMYRVGDLSKIEKIIQDKGYFMEESGHLVKDWCNDFTRDYFGLQANEDHFKMFTAGLLGLNKNNAQSVEFFARWKASAKAGCFKGDWTNHRHDMTCASIIAQRMGLEYQPVLSHIAFIGAEYPEAAKDVVFNCQGIC
jgi:hypothetical protein